MDKPAVFLLGRVAWSLFVTLTFRRANIPEVTRRKCFFTFMRDVAAQNGLHFRTLIWLRRGEHGELNGRFHYHALIAGVPPHNLNDVANLRLMALWENQKPLARTMIGGRVRLLSSLCGQARVRVFNPGMSGLDYVLPSGNDEGPNGQRSQLNANRYESAKFGYADTLEYSKSLVLVLRNGLSRSLDGAGCGTNRRSGKIRQDTQKSASGTENQTQERKSVPPFCLTTIPAITEGGDINHEEVEPPYTGHKVSWTEQGTGVYVCG